MSTAVTRPPGAVRGRLAVAALYAGGFLGPFGGGMVSPVLPEIGADFHTGAGAAALSLTAYMIPFAGLMLFSGTWGQRWGAVRTTRLAYVVYLVMSLACVLPGPFWLFLGARAMQGAANAFTTPLLLAAVAEVTPKARLGRALGLFGSLQAAGQTSAPLVAGLVAAASWRYAFVGAAAVAGVLAVVGLPARAGGAGAVAHRLRTAWRPATLRIGLAAFLGWGCLGGLSFLVSFRAQDGFGLDAGARGALLTVFGVAGMLAARPVGNLADRWGGRRCVPLGMVAGAALVAAVGLLPWPVAVGVGWAACGVASQFVLVGVNSLALGGGDNRAGAVSVVQACRFLGAALAPVALTPAYHADGFVAFGVAAALLAAGAPVVLFGRRRPSEGHPE